MSTKNPIFRSKGLLILYLLGPSRNPSYYFLAFICFLGSFVFLSVASFSYRGKDLLLLFEKIHDFPFIPDSIYLPFFPQGVTMGLCGIVCLFFGFYFLLIIFWDVNGGCDIFDKNKGKVSFIRWGFPNDTTLEIPMEEIVSVRIAPQKKTNFFNRTLTLGMRSFVWKPNKMDLLL